jgi:hypothetical protein
MNTFSDSQTTLPVCATLAIAVSSNSTNVASARVMAMMDERMATPGARGGGGEESGVSHRASQSWMQKRPNGRIKKCYIPEKDQSVATSREAL